MAFFVRCIRFIPMATAMGIIFFLSHQSGLSMAVSLPPGADKVGHAILYAFLAGTVIYAVAPISSQRKRRTGLLVVLFCLLYGISDELHQAFVPGRDPSVGDLLADTAGAAAMVALWLFSVAARVVKTV